MVYERRKASHPSLRRARIRPGELQGGLPNVSPWEVYRTNENQNKVHSSKNWRDSSIGAVVIHRNHNGMENHT